MTNHTSIEAEFKGTCYKLYCNMIRPLFQELSTKNWKNPGFPYSDELCGRLILDNDIFRAAFKRYLSQSGTVGLFHLP